MRFSPVSLGMVVLLSLLIALGSTVGGASAKEEKNAAGPYSLPGESARPVEPRTCWERLRTRMMLRSKTWLDLRPTRDPTDHVRLLADVPYGAEPGQNLDLYLPRKGKFPVMVFVHGGAWISEDKIYYGLVGRYLAENGVGAAVINYRLPPQTNGEGELRDVAAAFAWTRRHAHDWGGDAERIFLGGHSAGSHLAAVVATNPCYLASEGLTLANVRGVVAFSGFYQIGINVRVLGVEYVFEGMDKKAISPIKWVGIELPPFLLLCAAKEVWYLREPTKAFHRKLIQAGNQSELFIVPGERHYGQILNIEAPDSPQGPRILEFIRQH
ncbi:MAG: alpha/beta hydrolase [Gemmataceae bacterium]